MTFTVAIAGITSSLAQLIAASLLSSHPTTLIRGTSRNPDKLPTALKSSPRVTLIKSESSDADVLRSVVRGANVVICCYFADNATMFDGQKLLIDPCEEEGVPRYIASDYTTDYRGLEFGQIPPKDPMKVVQPYLKLKAAVQGVHILVGMYMETFWTTFGVLDVEAKTLNYFGSGSEKFDLTSMKTVADYTAAVAVDESAVGFLKFRGDCLSIPEIAEKIATVYGFTPKLSRRGDDEDLSPILGAFKLITSLQGNGKIALGDDIANSRYPDIKPENLQAYLSGRAVDELVEADANVQAQLEHLKKS